ncbi:MAG: bifunctional nuclease family protein [Marinilabiliales bacterium]
MDKIKLKVIGLSYSQTQSGAYALVLSEETEKIKLPIIIGGFEAQAIAIELEAMKPPRPLTHDLFVNFAKEADIQVLEVIISKLEEGIFYSDIIFKTKTSIKKIDARTSDAVALALRFKCPIYTTREILSKAGIQLDFPSYSSDTPQSDIDELSSESSLSNISDEELEQLLNEAVEKEDYEKAMEIKKEIEKRKKKD